MTELHQPRLTEEKSKVLTAIQMSSSVAHTKSRGIDLLKYLNTGSKKAQYNNGSDCTKHIIIHGMKLN